MQFTTFALAALLGLAEAQKVHVVNVGSKNNSLVYSPSKLAAPVGDMIQFQFVSGNHTVTQSTFDAPCAPIAMSSANVTGVYSGFQPVSASAAMGMVPTYTIMIRNTNPLWFYCSQGKHCQNGMVMVINENTAANASRSLDNFKSLAKLATVNLPGGATAGGNTGTGSNTGAGTGTGTGTGTGSNTGAGTGSNTGGATGTGTGASASASATPVTAGAASFAISGTLGLAGAAAALFML